MSIKILHKIDKLKKKISVLEKELELVRILEKDVPDLGVIFINSSLRISYFTSHSIIPDRYEFVSFFDKPGSLCFYKEISGVKIYKLLGKSPFIKVLDYRYDGKVTIVTYILNRIRCEGVQWSIPEWLINDAIKRFESSSNQAFLFDSFQPYTKTCPYSILTSG